MTNNLVSDPGQYRIPRPVEMPTANELAVAPEQVRPTTPEPTHPSLLTEEADLGLAELRQSHYIDSLSSHDAGRREIEVTAARDATDRIYDQSGEANQARMETVEHTAEVDAVAAARRAQELSGVVLTYRNTRAGYELAA